MNKVVVCVPYGRKKFLECLLPHLWAQRHHIDEIRFWVNTDNAESLTYLGQLLATDSIFTAEHVNDGERPSVWRMRHFYKNCTEPDTIYIKVDDDVVWMDGTAIESLIVSRKWNDEPFLVYANTINNNICAVLHQQCGALPTNVIKAEYVQSDYYVFTDQAFVRQQHEVFRKHYDDGTLDHYFFGYWVDHACTRMCINMVSWWGKDMAQALPFSQDQDELELAVEVPRRLGRPVACTGDALCVHYSYSTQWQHLDDNVHLGFYRQLSDKVAAECAWPLYSGDSPK